MLKKEGNQERFPLFEAARVIGYQESETATVHWLGTSGVAALFSVPLVNAIFFPLKSYFVPDTIAAPLLKSGPKTASTGSMVFPVLGETTLDPPGPG